ncbi:MAG: hypothetical protein WAT71_15970 [Ignavibacteria bacterium]
MKINNTDFSRHLFWNYKADADLGEEIIIERVILYGESEDFKNMKKYFSTEKISKVTDDIEKTGRYKKRINFVRKIIL